MKKRLFDLGGFRGRVLPKSGGAVVIAPVAPAKPLFQAERFKPHEFEKRVFILKVGFSDPRVEISVRAYLDMYYITGYAGSGEVGWLGTVTRRGSILRIEEVFLFKQEVTGSSTELDSGHIAEVVTRLIQEGYMDKVNALKFWGHVHPGNGTNPSSQDEETMGILSDGNDWFLRGIFGRAGRAEFTLFDFKGNTRYEDVPWSLVPADSEARRTFIRDEAAKLVSLGSYYTASWSPGHGKIYGDGGDSFSGEPSVRPEEEPLTSAGQETEAVVAEEKTATAEEGKEADGGAPAKTDEGELVKH